MAFEKKTLQTSNPYKQSDMVKVTRTIYYAEVISIDDPTDGGRIKARIDFFDNEVLNEDLPWAYPLIPKFFHAYPKVGEIVRIFIEDIRYPKRSRFWMGSVISQPHKINFDSIYTAQSTTDMALTNPEKAPSTFPDAEGVFPKKTDIALVGRKNTDIILRNNEIHIRTGKHFDGEPLKLNILNPSTFSQVFEEDDGDFRSSTVVLSDKIALISHDGNPKFRASELDKEDRDDIFERGHPLARADVLVKAMNIMRNAIIQHIHGYATIPPDKNDVINELENINFEAIIQKNIVIN